MPGNNISTVPVHYSFVGQNLTLKLLDHPCFREMGNAHLVELVEEARRSRTPATQQAVAGAVDEDAGAEPANDGAAGGGGGDPAVARDPKKYCWNCKTCEHHVAVKLRLCSGCNRVRCFLLSAPQSGALKISAYRDCQPIPSHPSSYSF